MKKNNVDKNYLEKISHGSPDFPLAVHTTISRNGFMLYTHLHHEFEFLVLTKGEGFFEINDKKYYMNSGDGIFVNSYELHCANNLSFSECTFFSVVFSHEILSSSPRSLISSKYIYPIMNGQVFFPTLLSSNIPLHKEIIEKLFKIKALYSEKKMGYELLIESELLSIWNVSLSASILADSKATRNTELIKEAVEFIFEHYSEPITPSSIAKKLGICTDHLCRVFKATVGCSTSEYLTKFRIGKCCELLANNNIPITQIAYACGFAGTSYFNRSFKKICLCTPSEYQKYL